MATGKTEFRAEGQASPASQSGYVRLAAAILGQAAKEAKAGDLDAAQWLLSGDAEILADGIGLSWPHVQKWAGGIIDSKFIKKNTSCNIVFFA
jgi:hypothetical protein